MEAHVTQGKDPPVSTVVTPALDDDEARARAAALPVAQRQALIESMLVDYPVFRATIAAIRKRHRPLTEGHHLKGQICGLIGPSRTGKSTALRYYQEECGAIEVRGAKGLTKVVYIDCVEDWTGNDLLDELYHAIGFEDTPKLKAKKLRQAIIGEIEEYGIELVIIDDAQFAFCSRDSRSVKSAFGFVVDLANQCTCNILLSGTEEMKKVVLAHKHAKNRGLFPREAIEPYVWKKEEDREQFAFLLQAIDDRLPFREYSSLAQPGYVQHFFKISEGSIGLLMQYVRAAALLALRDDADCIGLGHIREAVEERYEPEGNYRPFHFNIDLAADAARSSRKQVGDKLHLTKTRKKAGLL